MTMKKRKLKLDDLELNSFVTAMESSREETVKGGISSTPEQLRSVVENCPTNLLACRTW